MWKRRVQRKEVGSNYRGLRRVQDTDRHGGGGGGLEAQGEEAERLVEVKSRRP